MKIKQNMEIAINLYGIRRYIKGGIRMKIYLLIYKNSYPNYSIQKVEDYWDLIYEYEPISIIEITKDMLKELKEVSE